MVHVRRFIIIVLWFLMPVWVEAKTYYTDYREVLEGDYSLVNDDLTKVWSEDRYRFYKEDRVYSEQYYFEGENDKKFPYKSDLMMEVVSDWVEQVPDERLNRSIYTKNLYQYFNKQKLRYFKLGNFISKSGNVRLSEFAFYYKGERLPVLFQCENCDKVSNSFLQDGTNASGYIELFAGEEIVVDLGDEYLTDYLTLDLQFVEPVSCGLQEFTFYGSDTMLFGTSYIKQNFSLLDSDSNDGSYYLKLIDYDSLCLSSNLLTTEDYFSIPEDISIYKITKLFQTKDLKFRYYNVSRQYVDGYYTKFEPYIKDEGSVKRFYFQQKRDYITIDDDFVISSFDKKLDDIVLDTSFNRDDILFYGEVNYRLNGRYLLTIQVDDVKLDTFVTVNINSADKEKIKNDASTPTKNKKSTANNDKVNRDKSLYKIILVSGLGVVFLVLCFVLWQRRVKNVE